MLPKLVEQLVRDRIASFATTLIESAIDDNDKACLNEMESFYNFFRNTLILAIKDGRRSVVEEVGVN